MTDEQHPLDHFLHRLEAIATEATRASTLARNDQDLAELAGTLNSATKRLSEGKQAAQSELGDLPIVGSTWTYNPGGRKAQRSFNTDGLLIKFADALDAPLLNTLMMLVDQDVLRITWQWSKLKAAAQTHDITLTVAQHEIANGDPDADVGETWGPGYPSYSPTPESEGGPF